MLSEKAVLCWLATVDSSHKPNVSPKEIFKQTAEDHLLIADIASARSVRNIRANPAVCVSLIDIFRQPGEKLEGRAMIVPLDHADFRALAAPLVEMTGGRFSIRHVIFVRIERRTVIRAPSYAFFPGQSEEELQADAYRTYGVQPISAGDP